MDPIRSVLLALARRSKEAELRWHAVLAAVRAHGETPTHNEAFIYHAGADLCLLAAIDAADLPANSKIYDVTLSRDPVRAAEQLREAAGGYYPNNQIEAEHEAARLAYKAAFAEPITEQEQAYAELLAGLPAARRDKVIELAERYARYGEQGMSAAF